MDALCGIYSPTTGRISSKGVINSGSDLSKIEERVAAAKGLTALQAYIKNSTHGQGEVMMIERPRCNGKAADWSAFSRGWQMRII
jgi:hypothetical protein